MEAITWFCKTEEDARGLEKHMIDGLRPKYNQHKFRMFIVSRELNVKRSRSEVREWSGTF